MKAAYLTGYGGDEVVSFGEVPAPVRGPTDVLIDVKAAGVNPVELVMRAGGFAKLLPFKFPQVPGLDVSGVVLEAPEDSAFKPGDEVFARLPNNAPGAYAERAICPVQYVARKPANLTHIEAAGLPTIALTTWQAYFERAQLKRGDRILIQPGAGGVGTFAVQLAKHVGAHVTATAGASNQDFLRELGVDQPVDYTKDRFEDFGPFDVVLDGLGGDAIARSIATLSPGGRYVGMVKLADARSYMQLGLPEATANAIAAGTAPYIEQCKARGAEFHGILTHPDGAQLTEIAALMEAGAIRAYTSKVFPLTDLAGAYREMAGGRSRGKVIIDVTSQ